MPINKITNNLNEKHIDLKIDEIVKGKDFKKSDVEIERYESLEDVKLPQEDEDVGTFFVSDLNEKK